MAGWDDIVRAAQPRLFDTVGAGGTEGRRWHWDFSPLLDDVGDPIDLSTGVTASAQIWTIPGLVSVATLTFTGFADGTWSLELNDAGTAGLATDATNPSQSATATKPRNCLWSLELTKSSKSAQIFGPRGSTFSIDQE